MPILNSQTISAYRILVSRSSQRPSADLYSIESIELQQPLPDVPIPLKAAQEVVTLPLQAVFNDVYSKTSTLAVSTMLSPCRRPAFPVISSNGYLNWS